MERVQLEARLYRDIDHDDAWIAWYADIGWVRFRTRPKRRALGKPVIELDAVGVQAVSLARAFNKGLIEAVRN